jgi:hypothetical protein
MRGMRGKEIVRNRRQERERKEHLLNSPLHCNAPTMHYTTVRSALRSAALYRTALRYITMRDALHYRTAIFYTRRAHLLTGVVKLDLTYFTASFMAMR